MRSRSEKQLEVRPIGNWTIPPQQEEFQMSVVHPNKESEISPQQQTGLNGQNRLQTSNLSTTIENKRAHS